MLCQQMEPLDRPTSAQTALHERGPAPMVAIDDTSLLDTEPDVSSIGAS